MTRLLVLLAALAAAGTAVAAAPVPRFTGCAPPARVRPASIVVACGDGNFYLTGLKWTHWTARDAAAVGTGHENDCTPYCAAGRFHTYRVAVRLFRPERCKGGRVEFTRFNYRFVSAKPKVVARSETTPAPFRVGSGCP
jgi:hypothetical protein